MEKYDVFEKETHLRPEFATEKFETLHRWELGWELLSLINLAKGEEQEKELAKRFSPGQKALYFLWYLDAQVTNGGFIQFYWNGYRRFIYPMAEGLKLIGDTDTYKLLLKADKEYIKHISEFNLQRQKEDWKPLYKELKNFEQYDNEYYQLHDKMMDLIEHYARQNSGEFVELK